MRDTKSDQWGVGISLIVPTTAHSLRKEDGTEKWSQGGRCLGKKEDDITFMNLLRREMEMMIGMMEMEKMTTKRMYRLLYCGIELGTHDSFRTFYNDVYDLTIALACLQWEKHKIRG